MAAKLIADISVFIWRASNRLLDSVSNVFGQVISLGVHVIHKTFLQPSLLMEVLPQLLERRTFPSPMSYHRLELGYRDSPDPAHNMAIVFMRVCRVSVVLSIVQSVLCTSCKMGGTGLALQS